MKNKILKISLIISSILLTIPSIIYLLENKTVLGFDTYYNFFINENSDKTISTMLYLILFIAMFIIYIQLIKNRDIFKGIKDILKLSFIVGLIFVIMLPWTTSDIYYYMGVGELNGVYKQNPYYVTMKQYYEENEENIDDEILEQGASCYWANTTVVYGPIAQTIFTICASISMKNINICLLIFKILNLIIHIINIYLIYKISNKKIYSIIYGINPFILLEFIANVHNDIIVLFFTLLSIYFLLKKKNILLSIIFLALATGVKYYTILLLPIIILYYYREEKSIGKRFLRCVQYGIIFAIIFILEYAIYFRDTQVLIAMFEQTERYSKSIYSVLIQENAKITKILKNTMTLLFFIYYLKSCIDLITSKEIKWNNAIKKYNNAIILFLLILTTFQQWYIIWLFATIMWQKSDMIKRIIGLTLITEIANSIYMFKSEWYIYDKYFIEIILLLSIIMYLMTNQRYKIEFKKLMRREEIG